jgi:hypothetical protein
MPASNVVGNAFAIGFLLILIIGFAIVTTITNPMMAAVTSATSEITPTSSAYYDNMYHDMKSFFFVNLSFLFYLLVLLIFYTSFGTENTLKSYVSMVLSGVIMTVVMSQLATVLWNTVSQTTLIDFADLTANMWFVSNIQNIFIVNLLIALCSFVFLPKQPKGVVT